MDKLITEVLRIVKVVQSVNEPLFLYIIRRLRHKLSPLTHEPEIIVEGYPRLFLPLIVCPAFGYTLVIFRHLRRCRSFHTSIVAVS